MTGSVGAEQPSAQRLRKRDPRRQQVQRIESVVAEIALRGAEETSDRHHCEREHRDRSESHERRRGNQYAARATDRGSEVFSAPRWALFAEPCCSWIRFPALSGRHRPCHEPVGRRRVSRRGRLAVCVSRCGAEPGARRHAVLLRAAATCRGVALDRFREHDTSRDSDALLAVAFASLRRFVWIAVYALVAALIVAIASRYDTRMRRLLLIVARVGDNQRLAMPWGRIASASAAPSTIDARNNKHRRGDAASSCSRRSNAAASSQTKFRAPIAAAQQQQRVWHTWPDARVAVSISASTACCASIAAPGGDRRAPGARREPQPLGYLDDVVVCSPTAISAACARGRVRIDLGRLAVRARRHAASERDPVLAVGSSPRTRTTDFSRA